MEWERREGESSQAYAAFQEYLILRSGAKVGQKLGKSKSLIDSWSSKYDWVKRSVAYDNSLLEETRGKVKSRWISFLERQYRLNEKILLRIEKAMDSKEFDKTGFKSLNEMKAQCFGEQLQIADRLFGNEPESVEEEQEVHIYLPDNGRDE